MIKAIIIDDEPNSRELLSNMLEHYIKNIQVIGEAIDVNSGIELIQKNRPDVVFLDIEMPGGDGFSILDAVSPIDFKVIFITGYEQYAIKAIKYAALDYLLKPVDLQELEVAIQRISTINESDQLNFFKETFQNKKQDFERLILPGHKKHTVVDFKQIIKIEASGNYVIFHLENKEQRIATHSLSYYESLLPSNLFFRIHKSYIINCQKVKSYEDGRAGKVFLSDGSKLDVAARRKANFKKLLNQL